MRGRALPAGRSPYALHGHAWGRDMIFAWKPCTLASESSNNDHGDMEAESGSLSMELCYERAPHPTKLVIGSQKRGI